MFARQAPAKKEKKMTISGPLVEPHTRPRAMSGSVVVPSAQLVQPFVFAFVALSLVLTTFAANARPAPDGFAELQHPLLVLI